ncbi:MAG: bifunctional ADP-dependent NAD(P)H-hydrate dehydratase/NAD(P)H-hydrate epimerase [Acidobacteria bacterium]|nr:MAG: bifunctional ADP-dependent NAD(P)H-hydrate dehydratase/NAD(P)H-hydrate epimerase [Acidobacteriota bacterium]
MKALTAAEMREVDRLTTERYGIPSLQLMENAGTQFFEFLRTSYGDVAVSHAAILCGKGNNGGDGFVVARYLQEAGLKPEVYLFSGQDAVRGDAAENLARLKKSGARVQEITACAQWERVHGEIARSRLIVDALLGTGLKGKVEGLLASVIEDLNKISRDATSVKPEALVAVDTPSALPSDGEASQGPVLRAHATVTFTAPKIGQLISGDSSCCGRLHVKDIGSPHELVEELGKGSVRWIEPQEFRDLPLVRQADSHKGKYGHVLLIAGSLGKSGAAILAGRGALRAGAGLVTVATPEAILPIVAAAQAELMTEPLACAKKGTIAGANLKASNLRALTQGKTLLAIGPGIGTHKETQKFVTSLVRQTALPVILDADGLNAFAGRARDLAKRKASHLAITPHPGEMARLLGVSNGAVQADRLGIALKTAKAWKTHVILKGFHTILATPDGRAFVNTTGNPGMAKGGSGDVLTGILAGMVSQFAVQHWDRALALGVYLHGRAGDESTVQRAESSLLAGEIADTLPTTYHRLLTELRDLA